MELRLLGRLSRLQLYGIVSTAACACAVMQACRTRPNFYAAAVSLSRSNASTMILWNQAIYQTVLFGKLMQSIFFGELRMIEVERLQERGWFAVTETLLALTIFKDEFESSFVMLFVSLLFLKVFHWLASDRVEMMEQSAEVSRLAHARMVGLLCILWIIDAGLILFAVESILIEGPTVMIMFASEYMILLATVWSITMKYIINCIDLRSEVPWEDKSIYGLYVDLAADFFKLLNYITFFSLILTFYGLPLNILRDVYITLRSFILKCRDLARYRAATRNMDTLYPDATLAEMEAMADKTCIICREDMEFRGQRPAIEGEEPPPLPPPAPAGPNDTPKKLPCGHVFHFHCLRSWLERQQSCPTCRRPVLPSEQARADGVGAAANPLAPGAAAAGGARDPPAAAAGEEAIRQAQVNLARNLGREAFGVVFPGIPFPPEAALPARAVPPPTPLPQPAPDAAGPGVPPTPSTSTSTPTRRDTSTPRPPAAATGLDNPLARFSLPELRLPPTGEAGLYSAPPSQSPPNSATAAEYAGLAYGAYPQPVAGARGPIAGGAALATQVGGASTLGARSVPNLEERISFMRERMAKVQASTAAASTSAGPSTPAAQAGPSTPVVSPPTSPSAEVKPEMTAREAALAAAERRAAAAAGARPPRPIPSPASTSPSVSSATFKSPLPSASPEPATPTATSFSSPQPVPSSSSTPNASPSSPTPPQPPRLIPLFSSTSPHLASPYPSLLRSLPPNFSTSPLSYSQTHARNLPAQPLIPPEPTEQQLRELGQLTRRGIEERLKVLVGWQDRMARMADEMRDVLDVLPMDAGSEGESPKDDDAQPPSKDKGKAPVEGLRAQPPL